MGETHREMRYIYIHMNGNIARNPSMVQKAGRVKEAKAKKEKQEATMVARVASATT